MLKMLLTPGTRRKLIMVTSRSLPLPQQYPHCQYLRKHTNITQPIAISSSSCMILLQQCHWILRLSSFLPSPPPSHHYISFSSSSSPPRVDSSPGMTLPRPFNSREEGSPPTGWRLQVFLCRYQKYFYVDIKTDFPQQSRRRKERVKPFSIGQLVVSVSWSLQKRGAITANISKVGVVCTKHQARQPRCKDYNSKSSCSKASNQIYTPSISQSTTKRGKNMLNSVSVHMYKTYSRPAQILDQDKLP